MRGADQIFVFRSASPAALPDLAGLRVRVAGPGIYERVMEGLGVRPVVLPIPRMRAAFEAGALDGVFTSPGAWSSQLGMEAPDALRVPGLMMITYVLVAGADRWASLGPAAGDVVARAARERVTEAWEAMRVDDERILADMARRGARIRVSDPAPWCEATASVRRAFEEANPGVSKGFRRAAGG